MNPSRARVQLAASVARIRLEHQIADTVAFLRRGGETGLAAKCEQAFAEFEQAEAAERSQAAIDAGCVQVIEVH